jgi:acyl carrier protein
MNKSEFYGELESLLRLEPGSARPDLKLAAVPAWDSLTIIEFISFADENLGVTLDGERIKNARTLADLEALCRSGLAV